jgi:ribose transport system substrate-binding protein
MRGLDFRKASLLLLAIALVAVIAAGCGGGDSSSDSATTESGASSEGSEAGDGNVSVDVGDGQTVEIPKGPLKVGVFMPAQVNQNLKEFWEAAKATAEKEGFSPILYDANFDPTRQLNQVENAIQQGEINAAIGYPVDSNLLCNAFSKKAPEANILVTVPTLPLCNKINEQKGKSPEELWQPGTLNFVGGNNYLQFEKQWFEAIEKANPGVKNVALVVGQPTIAQTLLIERAVGELEEEHPDFHISDFIYSDYTAPDAFKKTQSYLQAHPETELIIDIYSPDMTEGVIKALESAGKLGQIKVADAAGAPFTLGEIAEGNIELSTPSEPKSTAEKAIESLRKAQEGEIPRFVDDTLLGSTEELVVIDKSNLKEWEMILQEQAKKYGG